MFCLLLVLLVSEEDKSGNGKHETEQKLFLQSERSVNPITACFENVFVMVFRVGMYFQRGDSGIHDGRYRLTTP